MLLKRHHLWLSGVLALGLLTNACAGQSEPFTSLTSENPVAQNSAGLTISANPISLASQFGVQINAYTPEALESAEGWQIALNALPANLTLQNALFEIKTKGEAPEQLFLSLLIPAGLDTPQLDVYTWDGARWTFLSAHARGNQLVATVTALPQAVGLFTAAPTPPLALVTVQPGQALDEATANAANAVLLEGVSVADNGALIGQLPAVPPDRVSAVYPVVTNEDAALNARLFTQPEVRATHQQQLASFAAYADYDGLVLDYRGLTFELKSDFTTFVSDLAVLLHAQQKALLVRVDTPLATATGFDSGGYDWPGLSVAADAVILPISESPAAYGDGSAESLMAWATDEVSRSQLRLLTSAMSVELAGTTFSKVDYASALTAFGATILAEGQAPQAGQAITLTLSGTAQELDYDAAAFAARYAYLDSANNLRTVWLVTADTLSQRLALAEKYHLGGVVVSDGPASGISVGVAEALTNYKVNVAASVSPEVNLLWTVNSQGNVIAQATAQPGQPYIYVAQAPGEYQFSAQLQNGSTVSLGSVGINVSEAVAATPVPSTSGSTGGGGDTTGGGDTGDGGGNTGGGNDGGGFNPPPPISAGIFELGGQVPGFIGHPAEMQQAGMKWVKFQTRSGGADQIAAGHAAGFKVLLSVIGDKGRVTDPAYWDEYAAWVGGLAASGADAIEVWNEPNIDHEWPEGQISGATYTQLLAKAYNAIKAANGGTIVISGGPAPTGAEGAFPGRVMNDDKFLSQMAAAGAANYMDCVGTHYNEGIVSATQVSGDPRDSFYSRYYGSMVDVYYSAFGGSRPLCFTELGYLTGEGYGPLPSFFAWASDTSVAEQAQWLAEAASLSGSNGKVRMMIVWNVDFTQYGGDPQAGYAIIRPGGSCPACAALDAVMP